jgi:hypothetical protein
MLLGYGMNEYHLPSDLQFKEQNTKAFYVPYSPVVLVAPCFRDA